MLDFISPILKVFSHVVYVAILTVFFGSFFGSFIAVNGICSHECVFLFSFLQL